MKLGECYIELKQYDAAETEPARGAAGKSRRADGALRPRPRPRGARRAPRGDRRVRGRASRATRRLYQRAVQPREAADGAGRTAEAAAPFRAAVDAKPEFGTGYLYLAKARLDAGDLGGAETGRHEGLALKPDAAMAPLGHYVLADVYSRQGRRTTPRVKRRRAASWSRGVRADRFVLLAAVPAERLRLGPTSAARAARHTPRAHRHHRHAARRSSRRATATATSRRRTWIGSRAKARWRSQATPRRRSRGPSHVSIFTGLYPAQHGIRDNISRALAPDVPTLAEAFKAAGFDTAAFVSSIVLSAQSGLGRGFDTSRTGSTSAPTRPTRRGFSTSSRSAATSRWPRPSRGSRTHAHEAHVRVGPSVRSARAVRAAGAVRVAVRGPALRRRGRVVRRAGRPARRARSRGSGCATTTLHRRSRPTTARGSASTARRCTASSSTSRRSGCRCCCADPASRPARGSQATSRRIDLFPTVLDLLGRPASRRPRASRAAASCRRCAARRIDDEPAFAESLTPRIHYGWSDLRSVRDGRWKYILAPRPGALRSRARSRRAARTWPTPSRRARAPCARGSSGISRTSAGSRAGAEAGAARRPAELARKARRARLRRAAARPSRVGRRGSEGQDRRVPGPERAAARGAAAAARSKVRRRGGALQRAVGARHRQLRVALLLRPGARRTRPLARRRARVRARDPPPARLRRVVPDARRMPRRNPRPQRRHRSAPARRHAQFPPTHGSTVVLENSIGTAATSDNRWRRFARESRSIRPRRPSGIPSG